MFLTHGLSERLSYPDLLSHDGKMWRIAGVAGYGFFTPLRYGVFRDDLQTEFWRGWDARFVVEPNRQLGLTEVTLLLDRSRFKDRKMPMLFGAAPTGAPAVYYTFYTFAPPEPIPFTGGILAENLSHADWVRFDEPGEMRFERAHLYFGDAVSELIFEDGLLREQHDRTALFADYFAGKAQAKGRHKRLAELNDTLQKSLLFTYEDIGDAPAAFDLL